MDMDQPLYPAPDGYVVDLANPQRMGQAANFYIGIIGMVVAAIFLGVRIYTKVVLARNFSADDGALIVAWVFSVIVQAIVLHQYARGTLGIHIWELPASKLNATFNLISIASILYCPFLAAAKFSLLFFYLTLSPMRWFRIAVYASMFLVVGYNIAIVFPLIFGCTPTIKNFDNFVVGGSCIHRTPLYMATAVLNMVTDIILLVLPLPMIVKLQIPRVQKAGVICIFGVGSATCVTSCSHPESGFLIEANLVIITGALPTMRLFFRHVAPHLIGECKMRNRSRAGGSGYRNTSTGASNRSGGEPQIIGSKPMKSRYDRMGDDEVGIGSDQVVHWRADAANDRSMIPAPGPAIPVRKPSKSGIVKTQITTVTSELAPQTGDERRLGMASRL